MRITLCFIIFFISSIRIFALNGSEFTETEKESIKNIVKEYLLDNPDILIEMSVKLKEKKQNEQFQKQQEAILAHGEELFNSNSPIAGNENGTINIVEFFDYNCIHCRKQGKIIHELLQENPSIRFVFKEFPYLSSGSETAAKAVLAAQKQNKYYDLHHAFMEHETNESLDENNIFNIVQSIGIDIELLKTDMESEEVLEEIKRNHNLGKAIYMSGTPTFIISSHPWNKGNVFRVFSGEKTKDKMNVLIDEIINENKN